MSFPWPSTDTRQMRQFATVVSLGYQQSVGISMPALRAASRIVAPASNSTGVPLIFMVGMYGSNEGARSL